MGANHQLRVSGCRRITGFLKEYVSANPHVHKLLLLKQDVEMGCFLNTQTCGHAAILIELMTFMYQAFAALCRYLNNLCPPAAHLEEAAGLRSALAKVEP